MLSLFSGVRGHTRESPPLFYHGKGSMIEEGQNSHRSPECNLKCGKRKLEKSVQGDCFAKQPISPSEIREA